jgi:hypothetical protein
MNENNKRINEITETLNNLNLYREGRKLAFGSEVERSYEICEAYITKSEKELFNLMEKVNKDTQTNPEE